MLGGNARGLGHFRNTKPLRLEAKGQLFWQCLGPRLLNNIKCKVFFIFLKNNHVTWWVLDGCPLGVMVKKLKKKKNRMQEIWKEKHSLIWAFWLFEMPTRSWLCITSYNSPSIWRVTCGFSLVTLKFWDDWGNIVHFTK